MSQRGSWVASLSMRVVLDSSKISQGWHLYQWGLSFGFFKCVKGVVSHSQWGLSFGFFNNDNVKEGWSVNEAGLLSKLHVMKGSKMSKGGGGGACLSMRGLHGPSIKLVKFWSRFFLNVNVGWSLNKAGLLVFIWVPSECKCGALLQ